MYPPVLIALPAYLSLLSNNDNNKIEQSNISTTNTKEDIIYPTLLIVLPAYLSIHSTPNSSGSLNYGY